MTDQEIRENKPDGATHYCEHEGCIFYFFKSNYGFRQIKNNIIQFDDANMDEYIKPL